ncbi:hypothetical protein BSNK01_29150 [Bacillaceae bacterium]
MKLQTAQEFNEFFRGKLEKAKTQFERALECKHTEFDDLYPYMTENPQFFWYKRYVAWQELLTIVELARDLGLDWKSSFSEKQVAFIEKKILEGKVLDRWFERAEEESVRE